MTLLETVLKEILNESVSINSVNDAIDRHIRVIINYHTKGENNNTGARLIEVYAYGLTKAGNPVIRAFQPYGDTTSRVPSWKFFRLDRISAWKPTGQTFSRPADFYYRNLGNFNPDGDETMSVVYKIAKFGNDTETTPNVTVSSPKMKNVANNKQQQPQTQSNDVYKTDTEKRMERLRQQLNNPIKLSDIKTKNGFRQYDNNTVQNKETTAGPKMKQQPNTTTQQSKQTDNSKELQQISNTFSDTKDKPISFTDFNNRLSNQQQQNSKSQQQPKTDDVYKTDTERAMERLRQQLNNPRKIDLSKIPKR